MKTNLMRLFAVALLTMVPGAEAQTFPMGFTVNVLASGLSDYPVALGIAPDGRVFICGLNGTIRVWAGGALGFVGALTNVNLNGNGGLQDIAVDPGWPARPYVYCYWTLTTPQSKRISRFTITGNLANPTSNVLSLGNEYTVIGGITDQSTIHNGGTLRFGPDGLLYCSIGEDFISECSAQDATTFLGKVIRFDVSSLPATGTGPPPTTQIAPQTGPFVGPTPESRLIWARGLRNPWRMTVDPLSGDLFVGDVGTTLFEEINQIKGGGENFGWPLFEGNSPYTICAATNPPFTAPAVAFDRLLIPGSSAIIAPIALYRNRSNAPYNFGPEYEGDLFYTLVEHGFWRRMKFDGANWVIAAPVPGQQNPTDWAVNSTYLHDAELGPDGAIYYLENWPSNSLRRVRGTSPVLTMIAGDHQPVNADSTALAPITVRLTRAGGLPMAGAPVEFRVLTGNGTVGPQPVLTDANGYASTFPVATSRAAATLDVQAASLGSNTVTFSLPWRGLSVDWEPAVRTLSLSVRHSEPLSPVTIAFDLSGIVPIPTPVGSIATSILLPGPGLSAIDGLGLLGTPVPGIVTGTPLPVLSLSAPGMPFLGGLSCVIQAYAIDFTLAPSAASILISNAVLVTID